MFSVLGVYLMAMFGCLVAFAIGLLIMKILGLLD